VQVRARGGGPQAAAGAPGRRWRLPLCALPPPAPPAAAAEAEAEADARARAPPPRRSQVRRSTYHEVVKLSEVAGLADVTRVQPYVINNAKVVFLKPRPQPRPPKGTVMPERCVVDGRQLMDPGSRYCSLRCKIETEAPALLAGRAGFASVEELVQQPSRRPKHTTTSGDRRPAATRSGGAAAGAAPAAGVAGAAGARPTVSFAEPLSPSARAVSALSGGPRRRPSLEAPSAEETSPAARGGAPPAALLASLPRVSSMGAGDGGGGTPRALAMAAGLALARTRSGAISDTTPLSPPARKRPRAQQAAAAGASLSPPPPSQQQPPACSRPLALRFRRRLSLPLSQ